ncbi:hypothetical protein, partial [Enterocloster lavalensis]|uniref:hypothetical protein n=1 Tax=Enterocloster lavalensis TaxID=460384 RepID=UPI002FD9F12C
MIDLLRIMSHLNGKQIPFVKQGVYYDNKRFPVHDCDCRREQYHQGCLAPLHLPALSEPGSKEG